jgi:hypothetical protein
MARFQQSRMGVSLEQMNPNCDVNGLTVLRLTNSTQATTVTKNVKNRPKQAPGQHFFYYADFAHRTGTYPR